MEYKTCRCLHTKAFGISYTTKAGAPFSVAQTILWEASFSDSEKILSLLLDRVFSELLGTNFNPQYFYTVFKKSFKNPVFFKTF